MDNFNRAQVLVEALPYIQQYWNRVVVIKYGGHAMENELLKAKVMEDIVLLQLVGVRVVLVHGGGPDINDVLNMRDILERRGIRSYLGTEAQREQLAAMRAEAEDILAQEPFDLERHNEFDERMHYMVMGFNDNEYIDQLARQIYTLSTLFSIQLKTLEGGIESEMQHIELIDVLLSGELTKAEKLLQRHIRRTKLLVRAAMAEGREEKP